MRKLFTYIAFLFIILSCNRVKNEDKLIEKLGIWSNFEEVRESKRYKLRQMSSGNESYSKTSASFFLICGSYSEESGQEYKIKVFCETDNGYKMFDLDPEDTYICVDNSLESPELSIRYRTRPDEEKCANLERKIDWMTTKVLIYTPEKYFPESIEAFNINNK
jgi:hypothetical protein